MPIPFIIAGAAAIAGAYGAKKGYDAYQDNDTAKTYNRRAVEIFDEAQQELNQVRELTNDELEKLAKVKISLYQNEFKSFAKHYSAIQNINFKDNLEKYSGLNDFATEDLLEIQQNILSFSELTGGTLAAMGSGALAGVGAFGGAGMFAAASTGTAISSLSGVAATNATLAWFGGGSLATGGLGMAGGTAILGGIVAGPVLAVAGGMLAAKAEKAKFEAYANYDRAEADVENMKIAQVAVSGIYERTTEFSNIIIELYPYFKIYIKKLASIVSQEVDYSKYNDDAKKTVAECASIALTIKNICDTSIIDKNGEITILSKSIVKDSNDFIKKINEI